MYVSIIYLLYTWGLDVLVSKLKKLLACYFEVREMRKRFFKYWGIVFTLQCFWKLKFAISFTEAISNRIIHRKHVDLNDIDLQKSGFLFSKQTHFVSK